MATSHRSQLAYRTFGDLWTIINSNWELFERYLPPRHIITAKLDEVRAIRNRVAHCREPHENDVARMELFLRDLDPGIRSFCHRYNDADPAIREDGVCERVRAEWQTIGHSTELFAPAIGWLYAPEPFTRVPKLGVRLDRLIHPAARVNDGLSMIYRFSARGIGGWQLDVRAYLESTVRFYDAVIHWLVHDEDEVSITIPACSGVEAVYDLIYCLLSAALNSLEVARVPDCRAWTTAEDLPETVLLPNHRFMVAILNAECIFDLPSDSSDLA